MVRSIAAALGLVCLGVAPGPARQGHRARRRPCVVRGDCGFRVVEGIPGAAAFVAEQRADGVGTYKSSRWQVQR